jgi:pimeloyl-ACP methyl ester carboxylesterase
MPDFKTLVIRANGLRFNCLETGHGPLALCLHGFPDSPWTYRYLLPALAEVGYRVVAPFMRGYAPTEVPADGRYQPGVLAADVIGLHEALGGDERAVLVAHDWGATAAYDAVALEPARWRKCIFMNLPPREVLLQVAFRYEQIKRLFYFWFFQTPFSNEIVLAHDLAFLDSLWADWSPGYDAKEDLARAKECLRNPANLQAALGYYRAYFEPPAVDVSTTPEGHELALGRRASRPALYLHGANDGCIALDTQTIGQIPGLLGPGSEAERVNGVGHFMLVERPPEINNRILRFLGKA